jgi:acyl-CoA reductase-like NAD-dependent aldehyde dehydrogenase
LIHHRPEDASSVVSALIADPAIKKINFTGSSVVGRIIAQTAASYLKPVTLELGGKCPLIVLEGANLQKAAKASIEHAFLNVSQSISVQNEKQP